MVKKEQILEILNQVTDPEIPVLTIDDMGIIRDVLIDEESVEVVITPTYSGCPAMDMIEVNIKAALQEKGIENVKVRSVLNPPWTTKWMSEKGKAKLKEYGIAPPQEETLDKSVLFGEESNIPCPLCGSSDTRLVSRFGSTPCKSLHQCNACKEPFDYFKCH